MSTDQTSNNEPRSDRLPEGRRSRFQPETAREARFLLQPRDTEFLVELYYSRLMSRDQAISLGLWHSVQRFNARSRTLFDAGLVLRHFPPDSRFGAQAVYGLGPKGCPLVAPVTGTDLDMVVRNTRAGQNPQLVRHTLKVVDVRISLAAAAAKERTAMAWRSEIQVRHKYRVRAGEQWETLEVRPDGYARFGSGASAQHAFVEVDLGHVSLAKFAAKVVSYARYQNTIFPQTYRSDRFAVLCLVPGERRMENLVQVAVREGGSMFRFCTYEAVERYGALSPVWRTPGSTATMRPLEG